jgi:hypothetical protein
MISYTPQGTFFSSPYVQRFKTLPGKRVGIMMLAVPASVAVWSALQLADKEAVFFNWE